ncbi:NADH dehydrogenase [Pseudomonas sp. 8AS]|uniref:hypothetical protein n=1 Tax=Pseudomonas sp. 8AS TaxID=2653163 RepID=UPI0012F1F021|nr:hypothetical protein [Pseudomonas sp. 8AS]VXB83254.1 NADH dehydrogenase [Pseudomonas sp. 8AS]
MFLRKLKSVIGEVFALRLKLDEMQVALGRIESRQVEHGFDGFLHGAEFKVFSQWGEDGILQAIIRTINPVSKIFIEFGVQNYCESNTRFLLINNNWSGLVIDGSSDNINYIKNDPIYWRYNLKAECQFIDRDNINSIFLRNGVQGEIGLLSIDIDGNDYWVWQSIDSVKPAIVVTEYNARFGADRAVTVPYDQDFVRSEAHYSHIYYGASLKALCQLGDSKGYAFVGCNSAGNNAFFVRRDLLKAPLRELSVAEGFILHKFREARDAEGQLTFLSPEEESDLLFTLPLIDVEHGVSE